MAVCRLYGDHCRFCRDLRFSGLWQQVITTMRLVKNK
jgi:hypothetical protein